MQKQKVRASSQIHRKRRGQHHTHGKQYLKVYWPYVPMLLIIVTGLFFSSWQTKSQNGVLAYATEVSAQKLLDSTNKQRSSNNKSALKLNSALTTAAQAKADDMATRNYWSHTTPDGKAPWVFVQNAGYSYQKAGENLAYGFDTSSDTVAGWMNSKTHRENLLDGAYSEVGFGYANVANFNKSGPETIVVAMYGQPQVAALASVPQPEVAVPTADTNVPVTSNSSAVAEPSTLSVAKIQTLTGGNMPWITFAVGLLAGAAIIYLVIKHSLAFKRALIHGEQFFLHHPLMDIVVVSFVMIGYVLSQTTGVIR